jgi:division protein CdvB (Snf7/Vps24/ESCRT-III family)
MPPSRITDAYLDDTLTKVVEQKTGLLRSFDKDLQQTAREQAVQDINRAARNEGILKDADERARSQLTNLFHQLGFKEVEFRSP